LCSRPLHDDSEQPLFVEAPYIRVERLGLANQGLVTGKGLSKGPEAIISIDVINDQCAVWSQGCPRSIQLEAHVALTVEAVVNEKINLARGAKAALEGAACSNP